MRASRSPLHWCWSPRRAVTTTTVTPVIPATTVIPETTVTPETTAVATLAAMNSTKGRPGAACIADGEGRLLGIITDGDIVRALDRGADFLERPVEHLMAKAPKTVAAGSLASEASHLMRDFKVDQLPVVDDAGRPIGLVDVQDLVEARIL